jgi:GH25 family lysozyme M1 (1,4-beta-N-acetylmuramidase)
LKKIGAKKVGALLLMVLVGAASFTFPAKADSTVTPIKGIDVSYVQTSVDWTAVKNSGIEFAMIRDGYGGDGDTSIWDSQRDAQFESHYSGAVNAGLKVGVYHYSYATNATMASQEADECLYLLNGRHLDYPVAYDLEDSCQSGLSVQTMSEIAQIFCSKIAKAGYTPVIYCSKNFFQNHLNSQLISQYDIWIAQWASSTDFQGNSMWQYTSSGSVPGISGRCDMDYSYVNYASGGGSQVPIMDPHTFQSDTSSYTFGSNRTYIYKITTPDTYPPTATSSNTSAVTVSGPQQIYRGYLFTLTNVGPGSSVITTTAGDGRQVTFTANGSTPAPTIRCDTSSYEFSPDRHVYCYKITTNDSSAPTAVSSNPSAVSVSYLQKCTGGYLYNITNVGAGKATITTTGADGSSVSFPATGTAAAKTLRCDTSSYTFSQGRNVYCYLITTGASSAPAAVSSNPSAVAVSYLGKRSDGYLYNITNVGAGTATITTTAADGSSASFPATGTSSGNAISAIKSDTPFYFSMKKGSGYQYKFTGDPNITYYFNSGNSSIIQAVYQNTQNGSVYFKINASGKGQAGVYAAVAGGAPQRVGVVTVA